MKPKDWIKVTDKLPEEGSTVIICLKKMHIAYLIRYKKEFKVDGKIIPNDDVLCWVEIVPPPSEFDKQ